MLRRIIQINEELCNGCGACVTACHEHAIGMINGKAVLLRDDYCDGLGDCLPNCPTGAITFIEKDTLAYDDDAVKANIARKKEEAMKAERAGQLHAMMPESCGCPGSQSKTMTPKVSACQPATLSSVSELTSWPIQLQLVNPKASFFHDANLVIAADCTAFAYPNFHQDILKGNTLVIACPKLDDAQYIEKLANIFSFHNIQSIRVVRMEVPCCGGLVHIVKQALDYAGVNIPMSIQIITTDGELAAA